ncbi:amino acid adenylation protein [Gemmatimonadetes bacterium T265]|nr:amino acid adenylation protein [Gemmatimonadetes bacterium T265]
MTMPIDVEDGRSLRSGFLAHAARTPDTPALVVRGVSHSYGALDQRARRLATVLSAGGSRRVERVAVFASRSEVAYAGTLGALYAGAAYVPLNPRFPVERTRAMLRRAGVDAIIADAAAAAQLPDVLEGVERPACIITPDGGVRDDRAEGIGADVRGADWIGADALARVEPLVRLPGVLSDDVAYLLFTSGTTGEPKGIAVTHANVLHCLDAAAQRYVLGSDDRATQTFDLTFDLAVFDLFVPWNAGASIYVPQPNELLAPVRFVQRHALTLWFSVPSVPALAMRRTMLTPGAMPSLRYSLFCGEPLPESTARAWAAAAPASTLDNLYGPTELTIACFAHTWRAPNTSSTDRDPPHVVAHAIVPIGRPLPGLGALVVDDTLAAVADGAVGELLVCGPQTVPGYWRDEARTAERFVDLAVSPTRTRRFYRTGDRVRRTLTGDYVYCGRTDDQVKVLGHRVELGEIESRLLDQPGVVQAAAVAWPVEDARALGIVAFVTTDATPAPSRDALAVMLPDYMVPSRIVLLDEMPLNGNGKIDRARLSALLGTTGVGAVG